MGRLAGFSATEVRRVAESLGWVRRSIRGDHWIYEKAGERRNLSIPGSREIREGTLRNLVDILQLSVDEFLRLARK